MPSTKSLAILLFADAEVLDFCGPVVHANRRFVDNGRVICSAGIAAGIDMSLHVVSKLLGDDLASKTAHQMEYPWPQK